MTDVAPIRKQLTVEAPAERAFRVFTAQMTTWWPKQHHIGTSPLQTCVVEPKVDGRWYEVREDGSQCDWGKVLAWDPPRRLVLAWQLGVDFKFDPNLVTEVEVVFTSLGPTRTRVDFEHRNLDRMGPNAKTILSALDVGWVLSLDSYTAAAAR
ncbi:MAG: ATPase [Myxococcales bacterium]|nr:ATPase [Myxococcales bacterium]